MYANSRHEIMTFMCIYEKRAYLFLQAISREQVKKWSRWDLNWYPPPGSFTYYISMLASHWTILSC